MTELYNPYTGETSDVSKINFTGLKATGSKLLGRAKTQYSGTKRSADQANKTVPRHIVDESLKAKGPGKVLGATALGAGGAGYAFGKAVSPMYGAKNAFADQPTRKIGMLKPTGKHVSHENDLHVTRRNGGRKSVGRYGDTTLQRYKGGGAGSTKLQRFGKSDEISKAGYSGKLLQAYKAGRKGEGAHHAGRSMDAAQKLGHFVTKNPVEATVAGTTGALGLTQVRIGGGRKKDVSKGFDQNDLDFLANQPGMINPGVQTSSWSHGTPNQNFTAQQGRRGRKIS